MSSDSLFYLCSTICYATPATLLMFNNMNQDLNYYHLIHQEIASLLLYQSIFDDEVGQCFLEVLNLIYICNQEPIDIDCLKAYSHWIQTFLASQGISLARLYH